MDHASDADARLMARLRDADPAPTGALDERAEADLASILASPTAVNAPPPRRPPLVLLAAAAAALLAAGGILTVTQTQRSSDDRGGTPGAVADAPTTPASSPPTLEAPPDADRLLASLGPQPAYDYVPAEAPSELASDADVVAVGRLVAIAPQDTRTGRSTGTGTECNRNGEQSPSTPGEVMRLDHLEVVKGQQSMFTMLVEVPLAGQQGLRDAFPLGTRVLVYAVDSRSADCQPIYRIRSPQGIAVQAADGEVVWPLIRQVRAGDLAQALPGGSLIAP